MMRESLKPRETNTLPPEKLLEVLNTIYPKEVAEELFDKLQEDGNG